MSRDVTIFLIFSLAILGPCTIIVAAGYASIHALGRNPSAAPKILTAMVLMMIFGGVIAIASLLVLFQIYAPKVSL